MSQSNLKQRLEGDLCVHIFSVSAGMVGVCLTVIGLVRIISAVRQIETIADKVLAADALLFLASCLLSYWALRTRSLYKMQYVERLADVIFLVGLLLMVVVCGIVAYAVF